MSKLTPQTKEKIIKLFDDNIGTKEFALITRRFTMETIKFLLESREYDTYKKEWISEGHYWLTELCEILDPQLEN